jgi:hypothetical protein
MRGAPRFGCPDSRANVRIVEGGGAGNFRIADHTEVTLFFVDDVRANKQSCGALLAAVIPNSNHQSELTRRRGK